MKNPEAVKLIEKILKAYKPDGAGDFEKIHLDMKKLRELAKLEQDPLVTKVLRLAYTHMAEEEGKFTVEYVYVDEEEEIDTEAEAEEPEGFEYMMQLMKKAENPMNRDELKSYRDLLKEEVY